MSPSQKAAVLAFLICGFITVALYWFVESHLGLNLPWWFYAIVFIFSSGPAFGKLLEFEANKRIADADYNNTSKTTAKRPRTSSNFQSISQSLADPVTPDFDRKRIKYRHRKSSMNITSTSNLNPSAHSLSKPITPDVRQEITGYKSDKNSYTKAIIISFIAGFIIIALIIPTSSWQNNQSATNIQDMNSINICKAAIASIMKRDPRTMKTSSEPDGIISVRYVRPADNSLWSYRCKLNGNNVIWATDSGRWRTDEFDEKITFVLRETGSVQIIQKFTDTSEVKTHYSAEDLTSPP